MSLKTPNLVSVTNGIDLGLNLVLHQISLFPLSRQPPLWLSYHSSSACCLRRCANFPALICRQLETVTTLSLLNMRCQANHEVTLVVRCLISVSYDILTISSYVVSLYVRLLFSLCLFWSTKLIVQAMCLLVLEPFYGQFTYQFLASFLRVTM